MNHSLRKLSSLRIVVTVLLFTVATQAQVSVGGHSVFSIFSRTSGTSEVIVDSNTVNKATKSDWSGVSLLRIIPFFRWDVSEKVTVDVRPFISIDGTSGASPQFGKAIGEQVPAKTKIEFNEFARAYAKAVVSASTEVSVGYVHPRFTWEYGSDLFWEDVINGSKFAIDPWTGIFPDAGMEILHTFEIGDALSIPSYLYLITGSSSNVAALTPTIMTHLEPDFGIVKFHLSGSYGLWDYASRLKMTRESAGISFNHGAWSARAEGTFGWWEHRVGKSPCDAMAEGGYLKIAYRANKMIRMSLGGSFVYHNFVNIYAPLPGEEVYATITPALQIFTSESSRLIAQLDLTNEVQNPWASPGQSNTLLYAQGTLGWRLTF